jgi:hypothetical protein
MGEAARHVAGENDSARGKRKEEEEDSEEMVEKGISRV